MGEPVIRQTIESSDGLVLRAVSVVHSQVKRLATLRLSISLLISIAGIAAPFVRISALPITVAGALWALTYAGLIQRYVDKKLHTAAVLQEMFYVQLFKIPWNSATAGDFLRVEDVRQLSRRYRGTQQALRDWYEMPNLPHPFNILVKERQNLAWGLRIRRRYANTVAFSVGAWALLGITLGAVQQMSLTELVLRWFVPSLGILMLGFETCREQFGIAAERDRLCSLVHESCAAAVRDPSNPNLVDQLMILARQVEDSLFLTRRRAPRVPARFFARYYSVDRDDFEESVRQFKKMLESSSWTPMP